MCLDRIRGMNWKCEYSQLFKDFCAKENRRNGANGGKNIFIFKMGEITACLRACENDSIEKGN